MVRYLDAPPAKGHLPLVGFEHCLCPATILPHLQQGHPGEGLVEQQPEHEHVLHSQEHHTEASGTCHDSIPHREWSSSPSMYKSPAQVYAETPLSLDWACMHTYRRADMSSDRGVSASTCAQSAGMSS